MPTKLVFSPTLAARAARVVFVGRQGELTKVVAPPAAVFSHLSDVVEDAGAASDLCKAVLSTVRADGSPHSGATTSVTIPVLSNSSSSSSSDGEQDTAPLPYVRVCFLVTPTASTRFNSVVRPDVITRGAKSFVTTEGSTGPETLQVVYVLPDEEHKSATHNAMCLTAACAIARALPTYTRKGNSTETGSRLTAHVAFCKPDGTPYGDAALYEKVAAVADSVRLTASLLME